MDLPGAFLVGDHALEAWRNGIAPRAVVAPADRAHAFVALAEEALRPSPWSSSVGGDQPKFLAAVGEARDAHPCIVKFSPAMDHPAGRRWGDLLATEHVTPWSDGAHRRGAPMASREDATERAAPAGRPEASGQR